MNFTFFPIERNVIPAHIVSHLTLCTPTKSNLHLPKSLAAVVTEPDLYRLLTFHVPDFMSLFHCLGRSKGSVQVGETCGFRSKRSFYGEEL
jgi:hypothetical protein